MKTNKTKTTSKQDSLSPLEGRRQPLNYYLKRHQLDNECVCLVPYINSSLSFIFSLGAEIIVVFEHFKKGYWTKFSSNTKTFLYNMYTIYAMYCYSWIDNNDNVWKKNNLKGIIKRRIYLFVLESFCFVSVLLTCLSCSTCSIVQVTHVMCNEVFTNTWTFLYKVHIKHICRLVTKPGSWYNILWEMTLKMKKQVLDLNIIISIIFDAFCSCTWKTPLGQNSLVKLCVNYSLLVFISCNIEIFTIHWIKMGYFN